MMCWCRFHLKEYPDYKYQPRKRPAVSVISSDASAGPRSQRRSAVKRLRSKTGRKKSSKLVPRHSVRSETPVSTADSELSELAESYLSSDWSVADDLDLEEEDDLDLDLDVTGTDVPTYISVTDVCVRNPETFAAPLSFSLPPSLGPVSRSHVIPKEPLSLFPTSCGRSTSNVDGFDWMEDYMTPEVVDLLADDWFATADNICLRDVTVM